MSEQTFPTFAGLQLGVRRSLFYTTRVQKTGGEVELRNRLQQNPRYRYRLAITCRDNVLAANEVSQLEEFFKLHAGRWDTFWVVDWLDSVRRRCRFDTDEIEWERVLPGSHSGAWWKTSLTLISVKSTP